MEHRTQIYLAEKHYRFLQEKTQREGISLAQAIRQLIEKQMPSSDVWETDPIWRLGEVAVRSGFTNGSKRHHEILHERLKKRRRKSK